MNGGRRTACATLVVDASQPPDEVAADVFSWWERVCSRPEAADTGTWKLQHLPVDVAEGPYLIHIGRALLSNLGQRLRREAGLEQVLVVSNPTVLGILPGSGCRVP